MSVSNSLTKATQKTGVANYLTQENVRKQIDAIVGQSSGKFITSIISAVSVNSALAECSNSSIVSAALLGQSLNLSPSPQLGNFYLVQLGLGHITIPSNSIREIYG